MNCDCNVSGLNFGSLSWMPQGWNFSVPHFGGTGFDMPLFRSWGIGTQLNFNRSASYNLGDIWSLMGLSLNNDNHAHSSSGRPRRHRHEIGDSQKSYEVKVNTLSQGGGSGGDGAKGTAGKNGENGKTPELRIVDGILQQRYVGESDDAWKDLGKVTGDDGKDGKDAELETKVQDLLGQLYGKGAEVIVQNGMSAKQIAHYIAVQEVETEEEYKTLADLIEKNLLADGAKTAEFDEPGGPDDQLGTGLKITLPARYEKYAEKIRNLPAYDTIENEGAQVRYNNNDGGSYPYRQEWERIPDADGNVIKLDWANREQWLKEWGQKPAKDRVGEN